MPQNRSIQPEFLYPDNNYFFPVRIRLTTTPCHGFPVRVGILIHPYCDAVETQLLGGTGPSLSAFLALLLTAALWPAALLAVFASDLLKPFQPEPFQPGLVGTLPEP
jgi:hypothetical protein